METMKSHPTSKENSNIPDYIHTFLALSHSLPLEDIGAPRRTTFSTIPSAKLQLH